MKQVFIDNTGIGVSRITFGTASLHHLFATAQRQRLLHAAASAGITHFDTSPYYGYGLAEKDLGRFLRGHRQEFTITTKVGLYPWAMDSEHATCVWARKLLGKAVPKISAPVASWQVDRARASLLQSLKRLKTDKVDFLMLHEPDTALMRTDEFSRWIEDEYACGTVGAWGLAGVAERVAPFVRANHPLARVVQTQDSLNKKQADFLAGHGRNFQFTYGYLSHWRGGGQSEKPEIVLQKALERNMTGAILVSTRSPERIAKLAKVAS